MQSKQTHVRRLVDLLTDFGLYWNLGFKPKTDHNERSFSVYLEVSSDDDILEFIFDKKGKFKEMK